MRDKIKFGVNMSFEKQTKHTYRYKEDGQKGVVGTLYIKQWLFDDLVGSDDYPPKRIKVDVEVI